MDWKDILIKGAMAHSYQLDDFHPDRVYQQVEKELEEIFDLNRPEVLKKRLNYVGIGCESDYLNRIFDTGEGPVLAGIRHLGGNLNLPFVYLWPAFKINNLDNLIQDILPAFQIFHPKAFHFWTRPDTSYHPGQILQQRFVGSLNDMQSSEGPLTIPKTYYDWYAEEYRLFHQDHPDYVDRICVNDQELMDECLAQKMLFLMMEDQETLGLIAGENVDFLGQPSVYLDEILVARAFRGKGYATELLARFIYHTNGTYLICHIDYDNKPSRQTALKSGQKIFSQEWAVPII